MRCGLLSKEIFRIALPAIVSNVTVPLLGMVDVAIVGHMGASYIGAIAVGGLVLNIIYWIFGFLRAGTSGLTAQALGENNSENATILGRSGSHVDYSVDRLVYRHAKYTHPNACRHSTKLGEHTGQFVPCLLSWLKN